MTNEDTDGENAPKSEARREGRPQADPEGTRQRPRGKVTSNEDLDHVLRRKEVEELLHVHRRTVDYYIEKGYLTRVYGGGQRALGVTRESVMRFLRRRVRPEE